MLALLDFLKQEDVKQFIRENVDTDPGSLVLNPPKEFKHRIKEIADQLTARKKARGKLPDWAENFELIMPRPLSIEQASSLATYSYKQKLISGKHLIDLTGGMGIDCLALSQSFENTTYVERDTGLCDVFRHNSEVLGKQIEIVNEEAGEYMALADLNLNDTIFYVDPARRDQEKKRVFQIQDCSPNLIEMLPLLEEKGKKVLVKYSPFLDIKSILNSVPQVEEVHVVSVKNDCKELLILINFGFEGAPKIICSNLETSQTDYSFLISEERDSLADVGELETYILEPNASIMKAGAFNKIAIDFNLKKLAANTHLYTCQKLIKDFPGRVYEVLTEANKKSVDRYASEGKINVITRNYPQTATELKKKLKLKDGGTYSLIAFRGTKKAKMLIAQRVYP
jgi:16S rRNA G966 N2-methylase RsmD